MSKHTNCLNCGAPLNTSFCGTCGQKAATHRFSLKHILSHDVMHGVFHFDTGFFYTAKELITRPGYSIREYVEGKRVKHYNYIAFLLLVTALDVFVISSQSHKFNFMPDGGNEIFVEVLRKYSKILYLVSIPVASFSTWLCFKKARQNFAEHLVMNTYKEAGAIMISTILNLSLYFVHNEKAISIMLTIIILVPVIYSTHFYNQYFQRDYPNKIGRMLRVYASIVLGPLLVSGIILLAILIFDKARLEELIGNFLTLKTGTH